MKKKFGLFSILLIIIFATVRIPTLSFAQQPSNSEDIPSDLSLDLALAQQNPAPEQKAIVESQVQQAQVTTSTGESSIVTPVDVIPAEIRIESATEAVNPEQTTSEQVVSTPVVVPVNDNQSSPSDQTQPTNVPSDNNVPDIPQENSSSQTQDTTNQNQSPNPVPTNSSTDVIPGTSLLEPNDNAAPPLPSSPSINPSEVSPTAPSDSTLVEGISTGPTIPWWQKIFNKLFGQN